MQNLALSLIHDDGAVVYINGVEVGRTKMPTGAVDHTTFASSTVSNNANTAFTIPVNMLVEGVNSIAVEVHNRTLTSSDISFDASLSLTTDDSISSEPNFVTLASYGDSWTYSDAGVQAAAGWNTLGFDSTGWLNGNGQLGYGDGDETTILASNLSAYYFRKEVEVTNLDSEDYLLLNMIYDDGAVIYVNGVEVERVRMAAGSVSYATLSSSTVGNNAQANLTIPGSYLVEGTNVIAVEIHNRSLGSSDISFNAELIHVAHGQAPIAQPIELFALGSNWNYSDAATAPANDWMTEAFDDSTWSTGTGHMGYGDGDEDTVLDYGGNSSYKTPSYYFRKQFSLNSAEALRDLLLNLTYDDGAVIYINGVEFDRIHMPTGAISHETYANVTVGNNAKAQFFIPAALLNAGTNTIAIEVHNTNRYSSDISFDAAGTLNP